MNELMRRRDMMGEKGYEVMWNQLLNLDEFEMRPVAGMSGQYPFLKDFVSIWETYMEVTNEEEFAIVRNKGVVSGYQVCSKNSAIPEHTYYYVLSAKSTTTRDDFNRAFYTSPIANGVTIKITCDEQWHDIPLSKLTYGKTSKSDLVIHLYSNLIYKRKKCKIYDLTQMFGEGNEPNAATLQGKVSQFNAWLVENGIDPSGDIPYNAGEIRKMTKPSWIL